LEFNVKKHFEIDPEDLKNPIVLIGWPGIALVGKLAIMTIRKSLKAEKFLSIEYYDFPAKAIVEKGKLHIPSAKVYYKKEENNDFFILTAKFQPQEAESVYDFSKQFCIEMEKITKGKIKMYISAGALVSDKINEIPKVHVCGTDLDLVNEFLKIENTALMEEGVIAGANGILPAWAGEKGFAPGICLLAETLPPLPMMNLDPQASKAIVNVLIKKFNLSVDFEELDKKIKEMENVFESIKRQADIFMKRRAEEDKGIDSYFR